MDLRQGLEAEFGMDENGSLPIEACFAILFAGVVAYVVFVSGSREARLSGSPESRPLLRLLLLSAACSAAGCTCRVVHLASFTQNGEGLLAAQILSTLLIGLSKALLTVLQFLIAKGWALMFTPDEACLRGVIVVALFASIGLSVACEIHEQYFHDQRTTFYLYEDWTGYLICGLNLGLLSLAWFLTYRTYKAEAAEDVKGFYCVVSVACGIYFAALPVIAVVATLLSPWVVRKYIERVELTARFIATVLLVRVLRPSRLDVLVARRMKNPVANEQEVMLRDQGSAVAAQDFSEQELEEATDGSGAKMAHSHLRTYEPPADCAE